MSVNKTVADLDSVQTFSHKTLDETCIIQSFLAATDMANLPAASAAGRLSWLTDGLRGLFVDTGTQWIPVQGQHANVQVFGADPTGATDSKAAIQLAIDSGYPVYIPAGAYRVDSGLSLETSNQEVFGDGWQSILRCGGSGFNLFTLTGPSKGITIRDLRLEGAATTDATTQYAIMSSGGGFSSTDVKILRVNFSGQDTTKGFNNGMLASQSCNRWVLFGNLFEQLVGSISGTGYAFHTDRSTHHRLLGNHFVGTPGRGRHAIYLATGASYCIAGWNLIENYDHSAITIYSLASQPVSEGNLVIGNISRAGGVLETGEGSVSIYGNAKNNLYINNQIYGFQGYGMVADFAGEGSLCIANTFRGNQVVGCSWVGIQCFGTKQQTISGNTVVDNSQASVGTYAGIEVKSQGPAGLEECEDTKVLGNVVIGADHRTALRIDPTSPLPSGTVVKGNAFEAGNLSIIELNEASGVEAVVDGVLYRTPTYAATTQLTAPAEIETINVVEPTDGNNFTIRRPEDTELRAGKKVTVKLVNTTGGSLGTITWFGLSLSADAWVNPSTSTHRSVTFMGDSTGWREVYRTPANVPN